MSNTNSKEKQLYKEYSTKVNTLLSDNEAKEIFDSLSVGKNTYMRVDRVESSSFDLSWIEKIEECIPDLGYIVNNPRLNTKTVSDIVPVELARKTNADSVKHLASHSQYVKEIKEDGDVVPNKVLNISSDDEMKTYENRFVATLIRFLVLFVEKRYQYVKRFATLHDHETLFFKNESSVKGSEVSIETKIKVISEKSDPVSIQNNSYIERIEDMRQFILYFYNSKFMKTFKSEKNVRNPILQTNIIRKNPRYHHCYELYRFIEAYDKLGVSYNVDEKFSKFDTSELKELNSLMFANYLSLQGKDKSDKFEEKNRTYKPEILTSSDDEEFEYGPLLKGPIQFVRVDEAYQRYLDHKVSKDIPSDSDLKQDKALKEYYSQEIDVRKLTAREYEEKIKLLERKKWQKILFDDEIKAIIKQREEEEEREKQRRINAKLLEAEEYLRKFRQKIVDEALAFRPDVGNDEVTEIPTSYDANSPIKNSLPIDDELERELSLQEKRLKDEYKRASLEESKPKASATGNNILPTPELKEPKVLPIRPVSSMDILTSGLEEEKNTFTYKPDVSEMPIETEIIEKEVYLPMDIDDPHRLTPDEKKAILTYNLFKPDSFVQLGAESVPFDDNDDEDVLKKIRKFNLRYVASLEKAKDYSMLLDSLLSQEQEEVEETIEDEYEVGTKEDLLDSLLDSYKEVHGYVVSNSSGYYYADGTFKDNIFDAYIFNDYDEANMKAIMSHGKVIQR